MVVLEEYVILPPYTEVVVLPGKEGGGLARIQMIVSPLSDRHQYAC